MSIKTLGWVWEHSQTEGTDRLVMLALADHADDDGVCWPGLAGIAMKCRVSERTVRRSLRAIEESGELVTTRRGKMMTNIYRIVIGQSDRSVTGQPGSSDRTPEVEVIGHPLAGEPSENHQEPLVPKPKRCARPLPDDWEPSERVKAWARAEYPAHATKSVLAAFKDHAAEKGRSSKDWDRAFQNWIRNEAKFHAQRGPARTFL